MSGSVRLSEPLLKVRKKLKPKKNKCDDLKAICQENHLPYNPVQKHTGRYFGYDSWEDVPQEIRVERNAKLNMIHNEKRNKNPTKKRAFIRRILMNQQRHAGKLIMCSGCKENLPRAAFHRRKDARLPERQKRSYCIECRKRMNREYYLKNKEKWVGINDSK